MKKKKYCWACQGYVEVEEDETHCPEHKVLIDYKNELDRSEN